MQNLNFKNIPKSQKGISLFDLVLWFTIVGIILLAIYNVYLPSKAQADSQIMVSELNALQSGARSAFFNDTAGYTNVNLDNIGTLPPSIKNKKSSVGGPLTVKASDNDSSKFTINYSEMSKDMCNLVKGRASANSFVVTCGSNIGGSFTSN